MTEEPSFVERILAEVNALLQKELEANKKEIRSLKGKLTKVSNRVDDINMLGFQEQLDSLNSRVKALRQDLLTIRRNSASNAVTNYTSSFQLVLITLNTPSSTALYEYITGLAESASKRINETTEPEKVVLEVYTSIRDHIATLRSKQRATP